MKVFVLAALLGLSLASTFAVSAHAKPMPDWTVDIHRKLTEMGS